MQSLEATRERLLSALTPLPIESVVLGSADGRFAAREIRSLRELPPFDNSAMDGYAVRATDTAVTPASLALVGRTAAGEASAIALAAGECVRVFTGAPLPAGADAVVMQEDTQTDPAVPGRIVVCEGVKPWENVRFRGEDIARDAVLISPGTRLGPQHLALLGSVGLAEVAVHRVPRVALLANGSELRPPGTELAEGQIFESNTAMLAALVRRFGGKPVFSRCVPDEEPLLMEAFREAFAAADLVITVGGASVGDHDRVKPVFTALGGQLDLWRVALKPGKPFCFGRLEGKCLLGLPGNPVSAFVTAVLLVQSALRKLQGTSDGEPPATLGILAAACSNPDRRRHFVRVVTDAEGKVKPAGPQASHRLGSLAAADGLVDVPPESTLAAGTVVRVLRW
ncbi:MAG TPA: gephyrin-like molybdotransferase Glp [Candidatus Limnocylindria bacterium]|jgi:molybdopterin molybdotransferase|nr:gephyrin-like molybdotransferase Glp [Candidatus Limnocylindria bacterium]